MRPELKECEEQVLKLPVSARPAVDVLRDARTAIR